MSLSTMMRYIPQVDPEVLLCIPFPVNCSDDGVCGCMGVMTARLWFQRAQQLFCVVKVVSQLVLLGCIMQAVEC